MNAKMKMFGTAVAMTLLVGWLAAGDKKAPPTTDEVNKTVAEASRPSPAHAKLNSLAGHWTYTIRCCSCPDQSPVETTGTIQRQWILGGRFLEERIAGTNFDGTPGFEAIGLMGYNNNAQEYVSTFACTMTTGLASGTGRQTSDGVITFQIACSCPLSKEPLRGRDVLRIESNDRVVLERYLPVDGKETKVMEMTSIRKK